MQTGDGGNPNVGGDAGTPDAGPVDSGTPDAGPPDAGPPDAGPPDAGPPDAGTDGGTPPDGGLSFGGPGPWPIANATYDASDGIQEATVIGVTTDETQNLWVATRSALYLMTPGQTKFKRFDAAAGLHLQTNPQKYCDSSFGDKACPIYGGAADPGINEIVGGGPNEVFVGYWGFHDWASTNDGTWLDPYRHTGKLDRVRLKSDGTLEVVRFDMVAGATVQYWHNRTVFRMVYDHFIHKHELYVGTDHGVDKFSPDLWKPTTPGTWFNSVDNNQVWMSDHLHPHACYHQWCTGDEGKDNQKMGDWRGLSIDPANGDLWVGGRWSAGKIRWAASNVDWWRNPRPDQSSAFAYSFGFQFCGTTGTTQVWNGSSWVLGACPGAGVPPVFLPPNEGDPVSISAVTVAPDGKSWWASATTDSNPSYGVASFDGKHFAYYDPGQLGMNTNAIQDMVALPDGRLVLGSNSGLVIWDPVKGSRVSIRAGQGIPSDSVVRIELDTMVEPPALHVATAGGAAVLRILP